MSDMEKYSIGIGDRFGKEGKAQLMAVMEINRIGIPVTPIWNKSNREHLLTGTTPESVRKEADEVVSELGWKAPYYVDADHVNLNSVDAFIPFSDFFTLDVAEAIHPGSEQFEGTYGDALAMAAQLNDHIRKQRTDSILMEISMDEVDRPQTPDELYRILKGLTTQGFLPNTVAPRFTGKFPKGVDYIGNVDLFEFEFERDLEVIRRSVTELGYPAGLKLSLHSGSDKFSLYPVIRRLLKKHGAGIHVKTAGTTWLEEVIGLARSGREGLSLAKEIYSRGFRRFEEMTAPYSSVLQIDPRKLPDPAEVITWNSSRFRETLTHDAGCSLYNADFRQLVHVSYKVAAELGNEFLDALDYYRTPVEEQVYHNLLEKHLKPLFG